jgi:hypothetical protein
MAVESSRACLGPTSIAELGGGAVNEQPLAHIPFRMLDELMILSMARWMKFIGVIKVVVSLLTLFLVLVTLIFVGAVMGADLSGMGKAGRLINENRIAFFSLGVFGVILGIAGTWLGFVLCQAAEDFERVVRSDEADQDYITAGLVQLKTYFKVSILLGFVVVLVGITAGIALSLKLVAAS